MGGSAELERGVDLDAALEQLRGNVKGLLNHTEGAMLARHAAAVPAGQCIVELGSFSGKSAVYMGTGSRHGAGVRVFCVDPWDTGGQRFKAEKFSQRKVWQTFLEKTARHGVRDDTATSIVKPIKALSLEVGRRWEGPPIGLLFIDGDHTFEGCLADFIVWSRFVPVGGIVAFHDYDPEYQAGPLGHHADVIGVCDELVATSPQWEHVELVQRTWTARRVA